MPLLPLFLTGLSAYGFNVWANRAALKDTDLQPKVWGWNAQTVGMITGAAAAILGGPFLAPIGVGLLAGAAASADTMPQVRAGLEPVVAQLMAQQDGGGGAITDAEGATVELPNWLQQILSPAP